MFDIEFYMKFDEVVQKIQNGKLTEIEEIYQELEGIRGINSIIYNIETTNVCNMSCQMCPRTNKMTRKIENMEKGTFDIILNQIKPHEESTWKKWIRYCEKKYNVYEHDMSENAFFLYVIARSIQLHGFGEPLLDDNMPYYIDSLSNRGIPSYFSCNPINIRQGFIQQLMKNGLGYIKFSIESINDDISATVRGNRRNNFMKNYINIQKLVEYRDKHQLKTKIVITMIDLSREKQDEEFLLLCEKFAQMNVYIYLKSENSQWIRKKYHTNKSIHWNEICKHPWMSTTIKSNGDVVMCMEDYNNNIVLGNVMHNTLNDIWNGKAYCRLRKKHIENMFVKDKCHLECEMKKIKDIIK